MALPIAKSTVKLLLVTTIVVSQLVQLARMSFVPEELKPWSVSWPQYAPEKLSSNFKGKTWADPEIG